MATLISSLRHHPTQFFLDRLTGDSRPTSLKDFVESEALYDIQMQKAFHVIVTEKNRPINDSSRFLEVLDKIQALATEHLPVTPRFIRGRVGVSNKFTLAPGLTSDRRGIEDLIEKIWLKKDMFILEMVLPSSFVAYPSDPDTPDRLYLSPNGFWATNEENFNQDIICLPENETENTLGSIKKLVLEIYEECREQSFLVNFMLHNNRDEVTREKDVKQYLEKYYTDIAQTASDRNKIESICILMRELLQIHLYADGNGRSIFLMANLLLLQNNLLPFYPNNMCIFDANSLERMVLEITQGQQRFTEYFGDFEHLTSGITEFYKRLQILRTLVFASPVYANLAESYNSRDLTKLFLLLASLEVKGKAFKFMLDNLELFNVDQNPQHTMESAEFNAKKHANLVALTALEELK